MDDNRNENNIKPSPNLDLFAQNAARIWQFSNASQMPLASDAQITMPPENKNAPTK
jgi:hypothetical protein